MRQVVSFVTLGVEDVARSRKFYEKLGFRASAASKDAIVFFDVGGPILALWSAEFLAEDARVPADGSGFHRCALSHNVASEKDVDVVLKEAAAAGAQIKKPGQKAFWGGYSGYFADPDGHLWEVAYNPFMPNDEEGHAMIAPPAD